jgi:transposase
MSIEYEPIPPVPTQTNRVAKAAFPKGNIYLTLRDELGSIFSDLDFVGLFSKTENLRCHPGSWHWLH